MLHFLSGPKPKTVNDFWRMIFEHKCPTIVMLTTLKEMGKVCSYTMTFNFNYILKIDNLPRQEALFSPCPLPMFFISPHTSCLVPLTPILHLLYSPLFPPTTFRVYSFLKPHSYNDQESHPCTVLI